MRVRRQIGVALLGRVVLVAQQRLDVASVSPERPRIIAAIPSSTADGTTRCDRGADLVFDVIGGDIGKRPAGLVRAGGTLVTIADPPEARPAGGLAIEFVVVPDRAQLSELVQRVRDRRLRRSQVGGGRAMR